MLNSANITKLVFSFGFPAHKSMEIGKLKNKQFSRRTIKLKIIQFRLILLSLGKAISIMFRAS